ncbi:MAG TPA: TPM domain-containing protein [Bacillaceae bacterium]
MKRALALFSLIFIIYLPIFGFPARAADVPGPAGDIYVQDFAGVLTSEQQKELLEIGRYLDDQTGAQIAVLTVPSLENETVEEYALTAFRQYGLGSSEKDDGVLLLLALEERKIRIEVGYGLEGVLPDGKVGRILDSYALPYLEEGKIGLALTNTYKQLFNEVSSDYQLGKQVETEGYQYGNSDGPSVLNVIIITLIVLGLIFLDLRFFGGALTLSLLRLLALFASRGGGGGGGFGGGSRGGGGGSSGGGGASRGW